MSRKATGKETRNKTVSVTLYSSEQTALTMLAAKRTTQSGKRVTVSELIREAVQQLLARA